MQLERESRHIPLSPRVYEPARQAAVVEDQAAARDEIVALIRPHFGAVHAWRSGEEALRAPEIQGVSFVCLDLGLPHMSGLDLIRALMARTPAPLILVVSSLVTEEMIVRALSAGAMGFVCKGELSQLPAAVATLLSGGSVATSTVMLRILEKFRRLKKNNGDVLSPREMQIAELYVQGLDRRKIAQTLQTSENTVKNQIASIYRKLQATSRLDLARSIGRLTWRP